VNHARIKYWSPDAQLEAVKQRWRKGRRCAP